MESASVSAEPLRGEELSSDKRVGHCTLVGCLFSDRESFLACI